MKIVKKKCELCQGTGLMSVRIQITPEQRKKARALRRKGLSYRKIGVLTGIKGPQSVKSAIEAKTL